LNSFLLITIGFAIFLAIWNFDINNYIHQMLPFGLSILLAAVLLNVNQIKTLLKNYYLESEQKKDEKIPKKII
jgi:hypothetical protein